MRILCFFQRHKFWARESMLMAMAFGKSRRCPRCNRLILKKEARRF